MLEWLKPILGDSYNDEIDKRVSQEIGKNFVSKTDFNLKSEALKTAEKNLEEHDRQINELKDSSGDAESLRQQIADLQKKNSDEKKLYESELARVRLDNAVESALTAAGAKNNTAVKALLADFLKDAKPDDSGAVKGLSDEIEKLAKSEATSFLFNSSGSDTQQFKGMTPGNPSGKTPSPETKKPKDMTYDELCAYLEANPGAKLE